MPRACADVREAELLQERSDVALAVVDAEALGDDALKIHAPPAHDAVLLPIGAGLDDLRELGALFRRQARRHAARQIVRQPVRSGGVEAMNLVAQRLAVHPADGSSLGAAFAVDDGGQRQQSPALVGVLGLLRQTPKLRG